MKIKHILSLILALIIALSMVACGNNTETPETTVKKVETGVVDPLSWDDIEKIPVATDSMTEEELRQICLDFMRLQLTYGWTVSDEVVYSNGRKEKTFYPGQIYGGSPYIASTFGSLYTATEYIDPDNGMIDTSNGKGVFKNFSNQCSSSTFWAWARVCNSLKYGGTNDCTPTYGCVKVGDYTYPETVTQFTSMPTFDICMENGEQTMFESYALLKPADGLVYYSNAGHVIMVSKEPNVVRAADGTIDGSKSTITFMDQCMSWNKQKQADGSDYEIEGCVDEVFTFNGLLKDGYVPFTIAELNKQDPVEKAEVSINYSESSVNAMELAGCEVTSNYAISNVILTVKDKDGKQVYRSFLNAHAEDLTATMRAVSLFPISNANNLKPYADGNHTVEINVRVGSGELLNAYTGTLVA